jgi:hypothetical protein
MYTPDTINTAEEQVRQWHFHWQAQLSGQKPTGWQRFRSMFMKWSGDGVSRRSPQLERAATISIVHLLEAVALGDVSPKAAHHLLPADVSTLGLLQAVAWGEISPGAAQHVLAAPQR